MKVAKARKILKKMQTETLRGFVDINEVQELVDELCETLEVKV